jgi:hypothetical protein
MPNNFSKRACLGAPFLLHETLGCPIANLHSARSDLWERQVRETERSEVMIFSPQ